MPIAHHGRPRQLPSNQRAIDPAKKALQDLAAYQQRKYEAAFFVNPIEVVLYSKLMGGIGCACTFNEVLSGPETSPTVPLLGPDGKATPETLQTILTGNRFGVTEYASNYNKKDVAFRITTDRAIREDVFGGGTHTEVTQTGLDEELPPDYESEDNLSSQLDRTIRSTDNRSCPICFGSGYIGGYSIHRGCRVVYDMRDKTLFVHKGELDEITIPNRVELTSQGYLEINVTLPAHVVSVDAFRAMRGKFPAENITFSARKSGSQTLIPMNSIDAVKKVCDGTEWFLRIEPTSKLKGTVVTHIEIQVNISEMPIVCEFPRLGENSDTNLIEKLQDIQINFPSSVVSLHSEDVIADGFLGKIWQVSASQVMQDHTRNIMGWDCNASVLQPYSVQNILPIRLNHKNSRQKNLSPIRVTK